ncbi:hypothetical protein MJM59_32150, partial [Salmonella enterica subsp. enterica serovar Montevideo]|nr:hypothetical protein [Salmonella enterica subsp. enterica serovar Montevideo]
LQGNGRTQLLDMQFDSGYWITNLYQVKDARWQRVHGWFGRLSEHTGIQLILSGEESQRGQRLQAYFGYLNQARQETIAELKQTR